MYDDDNDARPIPIHSNIQINIPLNGSIQNVLNQTIQTLTSGATNGIVASATVLLSPNKSYIGNVYIEHDNITIKTSRNDTGEEGGGERADGGGGGGGKHLHCRGTIVGCVTVSDQCGVRMTDLNIMHPKQRIAIEVNNPVRIFLADYSRYYELLLRRPLTHSF